MCYVHRRVPHHQPIPKNKADELGIKKLPERDEKPLLSIRVRQTVWGLNSWIRVLSQETEAKTQQLFRKSVNKVTIRFETQGNLCGVVTVRVA